MDITITRYVTLKIEDIDVQLSQVNDGAVRGTLTNKTGGVGIENLEMFWPFLAAAIQEFRGPK